MRKAVVIFISVFLFFSFAIVVTTPNFFPFLFQLTFNRDIKLQQVDSRINIILLGTSGLNHEGPNLTDTIIFASLNPSKKNVTLASIPRDLFLPDLNGKINTAYSKGEEKRKGGGLILSKKAVSKILNQPIQYGIQVNFEAFVKAVDLIGGLDLYVDRSFNDYEYPIVGKETDTCGAKEEDLPVLATASSQLEAFPCRYTLVRFDGGLSNLDGKRALEFVRSRHAQGPEGTDFARSRRQEKVISAFKNKVFAIQTLANPAKVIALYNILRSNIDTDINPGEFDDFVRLFNKMKDAKIRSAVLDFGDNREGRPGILMHPDITSEYNFEWVLIPKKGNGNFREIQDYVACEIKIGDCIIPN